jgi:hypothetical protein
MTRASTPTSRHGRNRGGNLPELASRVRRARKKKTGRDSHGVELIAPWQGAHRVDDPIEDGGRGRTHALVGYPVAGNTDDPTQLDATLSIT